MPATSVGMTSFGCNRTHRPRHNFALMCPHRPILGMRAGVMVSRTRHNRAVLLILAAGIGLASVPQASAQAGPAGEDPQAENAQAPAGAAAPAEAKDPATKGPGLDSCQPKL